MSVMMRARGSYPAWRRPQSRVFNSVNKIDGSLVIPARTSSSLTGKEEKQENNVPAFGTAVPSDNASPVWRSAKARSTFLHYFIKEHRHSFVPSSPVVPWQDSTLAFVNAGMNQVRYFTYLRIENREHDATKFVSRIFNLPHYSCLAERKVFRPVVRIYKVASLDHFPLIDVCQRVCDCV